MLLFLCNIPSGSTRDELKRFVRMAIRTDWMARLLYHPKVEKADILKIKTKGHSTWEHHGLVRISPSSAGPMVMELLRQRKFRGRGLDVRTYNSRRLHDRRHAYTDPLLLEFKDRRDMERRRDLKLSTTRPAMRRVEYLNPNKGYEWRIRRRVQAEQADKPSAKKTRPKPGDR